jgi:hypothetical protein
MEVRSRLGWLVSVTASIAATGPARGDTACTGVLTQQALTRGYQATLPPHVSTVLGLSKGESVPVRQLMSRAADKVHTYNVSVAHPRDVVLFLADEHAQSTVAYLLTSGGKLRKAVSYRAGGEPQELAASEARPGLAREMRYWCDHAAAGPASPPNPAPRPPGGPTTR